MGGQHLEGSDTGVLLFGSHGRDELTELIRSVEDLGFGTLWLADERFFRDPWATLAWAAAHTTRLQLGVMVTDPFIRHPALTAMAAASVDDLSGGRMTLGMGAGISGFAELGITRSRPLTALRESISLIRALLRGEQVDYDGATSSFHGGPLGVPTRPGLPIIIATNGPRTMTLAGELADGLVVQSLASEAMVLAVQSHLDVGLEKSGRSRTEFSLMARLDTAIDDDGDAARDAMRPSMVRHLKTHAPGFVSQRLAGLTVPEDLGKAVQALGYGHDVAGAGEVEAAVPDHFIRRLCLAGTVQETSEQVATLLRAGVSAITICPIATPSASVADVMRRFVTEVMPRARSRAAQ